jgi:hypothetical protein
VKSVCLAAGWIEPQQLIWFNNLIPSLFVGFIVHQRLAAQMLEEPETL